MNNHLWKVQELNLTEMDDLQRGELKAVRIPKNMAGNKSHRHKQAGKISKHKQSTGVQTSQRSQVD
ncbi:hypothetical protein GHT06_014206 [Daphnia sinensis]|uniref:Uncharacterized protein n=1 Tax=Daphnia sinensis TaxID=1820382 RepID=A0AAD5PV02_9CRUS|nr:hypothetical protein GHT06_014206 [Daphnia sinensis]